MFVKVGLNWFEPTKPWAEYEHQALVGAKPCLAGGACADFHSLSFQLGMRTELGRLQLPVRLQLQQPLA